MLVLPLLLAQTPAFLPTDPRLDRPLAIETRISSLPELVESIGRQLGTDLTVERRMNGLKAAVFVPSRPARGTLDGLASVFAAEWVPAASGGYRLEQSIVARNRRENYQAQEVAARELEFATRYTTESGSNGDLARAIAATLQMPRSDARRRLLEEEIVILPHIGAPPRDVFVRRRRFGEQIDGQWNDGGGISWGLDWVSSPKLEVSAFRRDQIAWGIDASDHGDRPMQLRVSTLPDPRKGARGTSTTVSDIARDLYQRSGFPVIAEANHYRDYTRFDAAKTAGDLCGSDFLYRDTIRLERGQFLVRPGRFWERREAEPPESVLRSIEGENPPNAEEVAIAFARLTRTMLADMDQKVFRYDLSRYLDTRSGLRLWGTLTDRERAALAGGAILQVGQGSTDSIRVLNQIANEIPFYSAELLTPSSDSRENASTERQRRRDFLVALVRGVPFTGFTLRIEGDASSRFRRKDGPNGIGEDPRIFWLRVTNGQGWGLRVPVAS